MSNTEETLSLSNSLDRPAGFFLRVLCTIIDEFVLIALYVLLASFLHEAMPETMAFLFHPTQGTLVYIVVMYSVILLFWLVFQATPGKIIFNLKIVDADTGGKPSFLRFVGRLIGYNISVIFLMLGFLWALIDGRKQTWHDKLANTMVVHTR